MALNRAHMLGGSLAALACYVKSRQCLRWGLTSAVSISLDHDSLGVKMPTVALPRAVRVTDLLSSIPEQGWLWPPSEAPLQVACSEPPLSFVEPLAVAMLGAWAHHQREQGREPIIHDSLRSPTAFESGLLSAIMGRQVGGCGQNGFLRIAEQRDLEEAIPKFVELVGASTTAAERIAEYCVTELARNVFDHARTRGQGAFCALSLNAQGRVRLAVADCGRGIPASIVSHYHGVNERASLLLSLEPEFSGDSAYDEVNRGVGLYFVRRLALAANGAFCALTDNLSARASAVSHADFHPSIAEHSHAWRGTAVAATFIAQGADFRGPMDAIIDEIEGRGPKYSDIQFFKKSAQSKDWCCLTASNSGPFAMDREFARQLASEALPILQAGGHIELDFTGIIKATQAFCHALIVPLIRHGGPNPLARIHFIGCSSRTRSPIRFAVTFATSDER